MRSLYFFIIVLAVIVLCSDKNLSFADQVESPKASKIQFQLNYDQSFLLGSTGIAVKFLNVTSDSRCPSDVTCIWQGEARVLVDIMNNTHDDGNFVLSTNSVMPDSYKVVDGYVIRVVKIEPYPLSGEKISLSDYVATFELTKSGVLSPLQQIKSGIMAKDVTCNSGFQLILKAKDGSPACVTPSTVQKLVERGWAQYVSNTSSETIDSTKIVTLEQNNQEVALSKGQRFLLNLGSSYDWSLDIKNNSIISRVPNIMVIQGAQGLFEAHDVGKTTLTATGDPLCLKYIPRCGMPSILFKLDIVVS